MAKTLGPVGSAKGTIKEVAEQTVENAIIREADQEPVVAKTMEVINPDVEKTLKAISEAYREADPDKYAMNLPAYNPEITGEKPGHAETLPYYNPDAIKIEKLPYYPDLPEFPEDLDPGFHKYPKFPEEGGPVPMPHIDFKPDDDLKPDDMSPRLPKEFPDLPEFHEFPEDFDPDKGPDGAETCPECHRPYPEDKLPIEETFPERYYPDLPGFPDRRGQVINFAENEPQELIIGCVDKADLTRKRAEQAESLVQDVKSSIELDSPQAGE